MTMGIRRIAVTTAADGTFSRTVNLFGTLHAVRVEKGDLSTPDITITDEVRSVDLLTVTGLAADAFYQLSAQLQGDDGSDLTGAFGPPAVLGLMTVAVAGGGDTKSGTITCLTER
jgi:hypothetical protein